MDIIIFAPTSTKLTPNFYKDNAIGGADNTFLRMCEILGKENNLKVYGNFSKEYSVKKITYKPYMAIFTEDNMKCDYFIQYRKVWAIPNNIEAKYKIFYSQDTADTPAFNGAGDGKVFNIYDKIIVLSTFHKNNLKDKFFISEEKFIIIGNATERPKETIKEILEMKKDKLEFIYCSTPFRGLIPLMRMWKKIKEKLPNAILHIYSSMKIYGSSPLDEAQFKGVYDTLKGMEGVIYHSSKPRSEVLKQMKKSTALLYPNTYPETYCNVIMEARSCLTPFITSNLGSLKETGFKAGFYIDGSAYTEEYQNNFISSLMFLINEKVLNLKRKECYPLRLWEDYEKDILGVIK